MNLYLFACKISESNYSNKELLESDTFFIKYLAFKKC